MRFKHCPIDLREKQRRICVSVWAYSYEFLGESIVDDAKFDKVCGEIDTSLSTGDREMDKWFKNNFDPSTGMWIQNHPYKELLHKKAISILN